MSYYELGQVQREQGNLEGAEAIFQEGVKFHREIGDQEGMAAQLLRLADVARDRGDVAGIRKYCEQSLSIFRDLNLQWAIGFALNNLALAAYLDNDLPQAYDLIDESVTLFRELQATASLGEVLVTQGHILRARGDSMGAYAAMTEALRIAQAMGPHLVVVFALEGIGGVLAGPPTADLPAQRRRMNLAVRVLGMAAALRVEMGTPARPLDRLLETPELTALRATLGTDSYARLLEEEGTMSIEQLLGAISSQSSFEALRIPNW
jgi:tetratricopeptide (TPR) repeat protein